MRIYLFVGFDGTILSNRTEIRVPHGVALKISRVQVLPKVLRKWQSDYGLLSWAVYFAWMAVRKPATLRLKLLSRMARLRRKVAVDPNKVSGEAAKPRSESTT
jgi:hypothetical protein